MNVLKFPVNIGVVVACNSVTLDIEGHALYVAFL